MKDPYAEIELQMARTIEYLASVVNAENDADYGTLYLQILKALDVQMAKQNPYAAPADHIAGTQVTLHVQDDQTGHVYSRNLPLDYQENNNGILLTGETLEGQETRIVFLSNTALDKISDLTGQGMDESPCDKE